MAEHKHGTMDTTVQQQTYTGFINFTVRFCVAMVFLALFLAVFAT